MAQKTDIIELKRGSRVIGETKNLQQGKLELSTWAMSAVYIEWPKVLSITTDKQFEIELADGSRFFGSAKAAEDSGSVVISYGTHAIEAETLAIVTMQRIKPNFWDALDGSIDVGIHFTQQNAKTDLSLNTTVNYKKGLRNYRLLFNAAYSRQDSVQDISSLNSGFRYVKEWKNRMFYGAVLSGERNSQLSLDFRSTVAGGAAGSWSRRTK